MTMAKSTDPICFRFPQVRSVPVFQKRRRYSEQGTTIVEFAMSTLILLTIVIGVMEASLAFYTYHFVSEAARDGTRYAIVRGSGCAVTGCPATSASIQQYVYDLNFPGINPSHMTVSTTWPTTGSTCTPSASPCNNPGNLVKVTVTYNFPLSIPFRVSTITMSSTSEMVISQ